MSGSRHHRQTARRLGRPETHLDKVKFVLENRVETSSPSVLPACLPHRGVGIAGRQDSLSLEVAKSRSPSGPITMSKLSDLEKNGFGKSRVH